MIPFQSWKCRNNKRHNSSSIWFFFIFGLTNPLWQHNAKLWHIHFPSIMLYFLNLGYTGLSPSNIIFRCYLKSSHFLSMWFVVKTLFKRLAEGFHQLLTQQLSLKYKLTHRDVYREKECLTLKLINCRTLLSVRLSNRLTPHEKPVQ